MPWFRERAYLEQLAENPQGPPTPVFPYRPGVPESAEVSDYGATVDALRDAGIQTRRPPNRWRG